MFKRKKPLYMIVVVLAGAVCTLSEGCDKNKQGDIDYPIEPIKEENGQEVRPHVPVPPLNEYGWLGTANILLGRDHEISSVKSKLEDYYSGYPAFMKVLARITKDRNVALKDNPAYLTDVFSKYYELIGVDMSDPYLAVGDYDEGVLKNALYLSWKKENEFSAVDNYDDMVTSTSYGD